MNDLKFAASGLVGSRTDDVWICLRRICATIVDILQGE